MDGQSQFITTLEQLHRGDLVTELDEELTAALKAARKTGKKAVVTLKLTINPAGIDAEHADVTAAVSASIPKPSRVGSLFYLTQDDRLAREDPRQTKLDLKTAESPVRPLRSVGGQA